MNAVKNIVNQFNQRIFNSVVRNKLVYNTCWEDPKIDRSLLEIDAQSNILMLTSAGCNALDYLLDNPARIDCVDINPSQNALLEFKHALFSHGNYELLWNIFGHGSHADITARYHQVLRPFLSTTARTFWDDHLDYFSPSTTATSFYYRGTAGAFAKIMCDRLKFKGLFPLIIKLINAQSLPEQRYYFEEIEPYLWNSFSRWLIKQEAALTLLGVPKTQRKMIENEFSGGLAGFIHQSIKTVFTKRPVTNNYFWRVYLMGSYSRDCCPAYLMKKNFNLIRKRINRLRSHTSTINYLLGKNRRSYSHFVLLDHQDWLVHHHPEKLLNEWKLILAHAQIGAKILFRSAGSSRSFVPDFVSHYVHFEDEKTRHHHSTDRVGTYGSTHLAVIDNLY